MTIMKEVNDGPRVPNVLLGAALSAMIMIGIGVSGGVITQLAAINGQLSEIGQRVARLEATTQSVEARLLRIENAQDRLEQQLQRSP